MTRSMDMLPDYIIDMILEDHEKKLLVVSCGACKDGCITGKCRVEQESPDPAWEKAWDDKSPQRGS